MAYFDKDSYRKGVLDGLAIAIRTVKGLPRKDRSSVAKLTAAIESSVPGTSGKVDLVVDGNGALSVRDAV